MTLSSNLGKYCKKNKHFYMTDSHTRQRLFVTHTAHEIQIKTWVKLHNPRASLGFVSIHRGGVQTCSFPSEALAVQPMSDQTVLQAAPWLSDLKALSLLLYKQNHFHRGLWWANMSKYVVKSGHRGQERVCEQALVCLTVYLSLFYGLGKTCLCFTITFENFGEWTSATNLVWKLW